MPFVAARLTNIGGREVNEDYCDFLDLGTTACWAVADGMGGHKAGETASHLAVEAVLNSFRAESALSTNSLVCHFEAARQAVAKQQEDVQELSDMRTTLTVLLTDSKHALWGHIGDTRLYYLQGGRIVFQTKDHSVPQTLAASGEISLDGIRHHPDRNKLLRSIGGAGKHQPEILAKEQILYRGDVFLLCTDGFWEFVTESEMEVDLSKDSSPQGWLSDMGSRLTERAPEGNDNYTALAVFFDSPKAPPPPESPSAIKEERRPTIPLPVKMLSIGSAIAILVAVSLLLWKQPVILKNKLSVLLHSKTLPKPESKHLFDSLTKVPQHKVYLWQADETYDTIGSALEKATEGETIWIGRGTYQEDIDIDKAVSLVGAGSNITIIEIPTGKQIMFRSKRVSIDDLTISSSAAPSNSMRAGRSATGQQSKPNNRGSAKNEHK